MSEERIEGFLGRWSRLKRGEKPKEATDGSGAAPNEDAETSLGGNASQADAGQVSGETGEPAPEQPAKDFSDFDFESLSYESDYEQFMDTAVPDDVRNTALRKLWRSNPVLANVDGLDDYCEDYTDAAMCLPKGTMKTAYRFGRGFLSDAEVAQWEALGKPAEAIAASDNNPVSTADVSEGAATESAAAAAEDIAGTGDWVETAATTGAGCAAALKAEEQAADVEESNAAAASDENGAPPSPASKA